MKWLWWLIGPPKTSVTVESLLQKEHARRLARQQRLDLQWRAGWFAGSEGHEAQPIPLDAGDDDYGSLVADYRDGYAAGQRALLARKLDHLRESVDRTMA